jgi:hypothetical protein
MMLLREILKELAGMFVADARLSASVIVLILGVATLRDLVGSLAGGALFFGCLVILAVVTALGAKNARRPGR